MQLATDHPTRSQSARPSSIYRTRTGLSRAMKGVNSRVSRQRQRPRRSPRAAVGGFGPSPGHGHLLDGRGGRDPGLPPPPVERRDPSERIAISRGWPWRHRSTRMVFLQVLSGSEWRERKFHGDLGEMVNGASQWHLGLRSRPFGSDATVVIAPPGCTADGSRCVRGSLFPPDGSKRSSVSLPRGSRC
jgi:hypothetical protein